MKVQYRDINQLNTDNQLGNLRFSVEMLYNGCWTFYKHDEWS
jgi:hypothetical protein